MNIPRNVIIAIQTEEEYSIASLSEMVQSNVQKENFSDHFLYIPCGSKMQGRDKMIIQTTALPKDVSFL